ncbi:MAG: type II toxin-antitoxin system RelE/ParE family toxin [Rhizobium sp.]|nr:type II toxin-antitoxin system RelE/ParE family toxin [Rhizobium sp.]
MAFEIVRSRKSIKDLDLIFDHLVESYVRLGETPADAANIAANRVGMIRADMNAIARAPYQGTLLDHMAVGLRSVTNNKAIFYFDVDEAAQIVSILAIFFSGQDHHRHMSRRLGKLR